MAATTTETKCKPERFYGQRNGRCCMDCGIIISYLGSNGDCGSGDEAFFAWRCKKCYDAVLDLPYEKQPQFPCSVCGGAAEPELIQLEDGLSKVDQLMCWESTCPTTFVLCDKCPCPFSHI
jgi:hypothetical protein